MPDVADYVLAVNDSEATRAYKRQYAVMLARRPDSPWEVARDLWPQDIGYAAYAFQKWAHDKEIIDYVQAVLATDEGQEGTLPTDVEYAATLWRLAQTANDPDIKLKYLRLYAEARGHLKRPAGSDTQVNLTENRVMVVQSLGSDKSWAEAAKIQQDRLQEQLSEVAAAFEEVSDE